jgi:hypothetical protein
MEHVRGDAQRTCHSVVRRENRSHSTIHRALAKCAQLACDVTCKVGEDASHHAEKQAEL